MRELGRRNLFYSVLLAAAMMLCLIGYFVLMLPSLYVDDVQSKNLEAIIKQHRAFMEDGSYDNVQVKNPTACMSVRIPLDEDSITLTSKLVSVNIMPSEPEMKALLDEVQQFIRGINVKKMNFSKEELRDKISQWQDKLADIFLKSINLPVEMEIVCSKDSTHMFYGESFKVHAVSEQMAVLESSAADDNNHYTNYLAVEKTPDGMVFSMLPVITPEMEEIRPIVMQSLPMLCAVILMLVLIFSQIYSVGIVSPVYRKLQDANEMLLEENERQEVFLRASSHQLKTPITAALLLLDGMIHQVGRYQDRDTYLPKVKAQLLSMRRMVEEILSMNQQRGHINRHEFLLYDLVQAQAASYSVAAADKRLEIVIEADTAAEIYADSDILAKILDSLLSNAAAYTPENGRIFIWAGRTGITVRNEGVTIPDEVLPHIFEPFVRGSHGIPSHGLGLYIAAYYAKLMGAGLSIQNRENGVEAVLKF